MTGCRNCGAPLPAIGDSPLGSCPSCGTLYGERAVIDEWADAVVAGRADVERPEFLDTPRLKVELEPVVPADYRSPGAGARLTLTFRYFGAMAVVSLLLGLLAAAGLVWVWHLAIRARSWVVPSLVTIPVAFYVWARVSSVFDSLLIRAADGELFCRQSRSWPRIQAKVAIEDIAQVFTAQTGRAYSLFARLQNGKAKLLVRNVSDPRLAVYFESQIERALGIEDRPDEKELPRNARLPRPTSRSRMILMELGMLSLFVLAPALGLSACTPLVELEVADAPSEKPFALKKHANVTFTSEIELTDNKWRYRSEIPRSFTFEIQILRDGREVTALSCDPFDLSVWTSSSSNKQISSFWGPMSHCSAELDSGHYTLRAVRRWKPGAERIGLDESNLGLRD